MSPSDLRATRERLELSQQALADLLGVSRFLIIRLESGEREIDPRTRLAVEHLLCKSSSKK